MGKQSHVHFLTAYLEYLMDHRIRSQDEYFGDASRFIRYLLDQSTAEDVMRYIETKKSPAYKRRLTRTLKKFYAFAEDRLHMDKNPFETFSHEVVGVKTSIRSSSR